MMHLRHCLYPSSAAHHHHHHLISPETPPTLHATEDHLAASSSSSLQSNLSLQTLPSVPSLSLSPTHYSSSPPPPVHVITLPSVSALALSGSLLYAASGHLINVYDSASLSHLHSFNSDHPSSGAVKSISFSSSRVFTAHQDSKIRVWKLASKTHRLVAVLPTLSDRLLRLPLPTNYVQVRRHKKQLWLHHNDAVSCLHTTTNNNLLYSVSWDKTLKIWKLPNGDDIRCLESLPAHDDAVNAVAVSPDGVVYTGSADTRIRVWARRPGDKKHGLIATLERHKSAVNALALSSDGKVLFSGACDRSILVWEREDSASYMVVAGALRGHSKAILCVINVSDFLFSGSADRTVRIWRRGMDGQFCCLNVLEGHLKPVKSLVARCQSQRSTSSHDDGDSTTTLTVFSGSLDGEIRVWKLNL